MSLEVEKVKLDEKIIVLCEVFLGETTSQQKTNRLV